MVIFHSYVSHYQRVNNSIPRFSPQLVVVSNNRAFDDKDGFVLTGSSEDFSKLAFAIAGDQWMEG